MLLSLHFPVTCIPFSTVILRNFRVLQYIGFPPSSHLPIVFAPRKSLGMGCQKSILAAGQQLSKVKCANIGAATTTHPFQHAGMAVSRASWRPSPGVLRSQETTSSWDHTVGLCLGPYGGPGVGGQFVMSEAPLHNTDVRAKR
jgi:hypothetical protein